MAEPFEQRWDELQPPFDERWSEMEGNPPAVSSDGEDTPGFMESAAAGPTMPAGSPGEAGGDAGGGLNNDPGYMALQHAGSQLMEDQQKMNQQMLGDMRAGHDDMNAVPVPQLQQTPKAPSQQIGQGALEFMQVAAVLGALAGGLARRGTTTALNAFSGAIKGFTQGKLEVFQQQEQQWRDAVADVKANNEAKLQQYDLIWKNKKTTLDQKMEEYKIVATQFHDEIAYNLANQRNYTMLAQANQKEREWTAMFGQKAQVMQATIDKIHAQIDNLQQEKDPNSRANQIAGAIMRGEQPPVTTGLYGLAGPVKSILAKNNYDQSKAMLEWQAGQKQIQSLNGPQMTRYAGLAKSVVGTIDEVTRLSEQMKQSGVPLANRARLTYLVQTQGNTPQGKMAAQYLAAVNTLKEEFANLANGGYAPTEPAWKLAEQQVNGDFGVGQLGSSLQEVRKLINIRLANIPNFKSLGPGGANRYTGSGDGAVTNTPGSESDPLGIR